jgi:hypothetical protein
LCQQVRAIGPLQDGSGDFYYFGFFSWIIQWNIIPVHPFALSLSKGIAHQQIFVGWVSGFIA